jgi:acyl transferase domain-containing protein/NAD(P)-dependent dehydrogenase (short-subunit alcohol dehydrogenase family)/acyl carrier protein
LIVASRSCLEPDGPLTAFFKQHGAQVQTTDCDTVLQSGSQMQQGSYDLVLLLDVLQLAGAAAPPSIFKLLDTALRIGGRVVIADSCEEPVHRLVGLVKCAQTEYPNTVVQVVTCASVDNGNFSVHRAVESVLGNKCAELEVHYANNMAMVKRYRPAAAISTLQRSIAGAAIITGGTGALGLSAARCLVKHGVSKIVLLSRSGRAIESDEYAVQMLSWLQTESGADVRVLRCDVSDESALSAALQTVRAEVGPIDAVVHAAGVVRDGLLRGGAVIAGSAEVWNSKAHSAILLSKLTAQDRLDLFIAYSSITAAVGNPGQAAYGAANSCLDALMAARRAAGLPGTSVQWPAVSGVGMAAGLFAANDPATIDIRQVEKVFSSIVCSHECLSSTVTVMPAALLQNLHPAAAAQFEYVTSATAAANRTRKSQSTVFGTTWTVDEVSARTALIVRGLIQAEGEIQDDVQLMDIGLDSLGVTELATRLAAEFGIHVMPTMVFSYPTLRDITAYMLSELGVVATTAPTFVHAGGAVVDRGAEVAIVGVSCRFPGDINDLAELRSTLSGGVDKITEVSRRRWDTDAIVALLGDVNAEAVDRIRYGGFLSDEVIESFDAAFFGISEAEASRMDPAQRLLLTVSYEALVDAGYSKESLRGKKIGVFVGASGVVGDSVVNDGTATDRGLSVYDATGKTLSVAAGRISYVLGLTGPALAIDTACSSSLVAIHTARRSLQSGECDAAVVPCVGVLTATSSVACAIAGMTSPDGRCHTFDESAMGYGRGEGCGAVVLHRASAATLAGNAYALISGSAVMQDGKSASLTAPNGLAQEQLLRSTLSEAGMEPCDVTAIEAHGTGTKLGDPVETAALAAVFGADRPDNASLLVTGVKANIGHLESAAGIAGVFAAVLALQYREAYPNAQLRKLNAQVAESASKSGITFPTALTALPCAKPLVVGVSSFGYSGTIAHVLLKEAPITRQQERPALLSTSTQLMLPSAPTRKFVHKLLREPFFNSTLVTTRIHKSIIASYAPRDVCMGTEVKLPNQLAADLIAEAVTAADGMDGGCDVELQYFTIHAQLTVPDCRSAGVRSTAQWTCSIDSKNSVKLYCGTNEADRKLLVSCTARLTVRSDSLLSVKFDSLRYFTSGWVAAGLTAQVESAGSRSVALVADATLLNALQSAATGHAAIRLFSPEQLVSAECGPSEAVVLCYDASYPAQKLLERVLSDIESAARVNKRVLLLSVVSSDAVDNSSVVHGVAVCAQAEYPLVAISAVNVTPHPGEVGSVIISTVDSEMDHSGDLEVAYEHATRQVRRYSEITLLSTSMNVEDGVVVITGGLGGLGLMTARYLAEQRVRSIVLVSRSGAVAHAGQGLEDELEWLQRSSGADVHVIRCDVSSQEKVHSMLDEVRETVGPIVGIVHATGVLCDGLIRGGSARAGAAEVWATKAQSALWLDEMTRGDNLKLFVLYSSITAAVGTAGQATYSAANRMLDHIALRRAAQGQPGLSIQWPAVAGVGMAASLYAGDCESTWSIPSHKFLEVLSRALCSRDCHTVTVMPTAVLNIVQNAVRSQFDLAPAQPTSAHSAQHARKAVFSAEEIATKVIKVVSSVLGNVASDGQLMDIGLDSLGATELATQLSVEFDTSVPSTFVFKYPTVTDICDYFTKIYNATNAVSAAVPTPTVARTSEDIAIIGMSCRFPGDINDLPTMWKVLVNGRSQTSAVSLRRWDPEAIAAMMGDNSEGVVDRIRYGGFLSDDVIESFNAEFFGISDAEARHMEPLQCLLLTVSYEALVDAGYTKETVKGRKIGVFVGASGIVGEGSGVLNRDASDGVSVYDATGSTLSVAAGRISYVLGLHGPSSAIDTACSSSLVALHSARRSLQAGDCDVAIVAGAGLLTATSSIACAVAGMTSTDGKCRTFDESAQGYGRGEGAGAIVIARMGHAQLKASHVYAMVRGSAVAQDGKSASLTAPNGLAQEDLLRAALEDAHVTPTDVSFIEAHGTGTRLGDPIETEALAAVFGAGRRADFPLYVSGVKANVGHLEAAAGMAGIFSAVLAMYYRTVPPNAQLCALNKRVSESTIGASIVFPTQPQPLPAGSLMVGVSSFGYSGTIAHALIAEPPAELRVNQLQLASKESARTPLLPPLQHRLVTTVTREEFSKRTIVKTALHNGVVTACALDRAGPPSPTLLVEVVCAAVAAAVNKTALRRSPWAADTKQTGYVAVDNLELGFACFERASELITAISDDGEVVVKNATSMGTVATCCLATASHTIAQLSALSAVCTQSIVADALMKRLSMGGYRQSDGMAVTACSISADTTQCLLDVTVPYTDSQRSYVLLPQLVEFVLDACATAVGGALIAKNCNTVRRCIVRTKLGGAQKIRAYLMKNAVDATFNCSFYDVADGQLIAQFQKMSEHIANPTDDVLCLTSAYRPCAVKETAGLDGRSVLTVGSTATCAMMSSRIAVAGGRPYAVQALEAIGAALATGFIDHSVVFLADVSVGGAGPYAVYCDAFAKLCAVASSVLVVVDESEGAEKLDSITARSVSGMLLCAQTEYPKVSFRLVTVTGAISEPTINLLMDELTARSIDAQAVYEHGQRLVKVYEHAQLAHASNRNQLHSGACIVTGGLGGLGLKAAQTLIAMGCKCIVLVSRTGQVSYAGQGLEADLQLLQATPGVDVRVMRCDVSDESQLSSLLDTVRCTCGSISGVVHAAGVIRDGLLRSGAASAGSAAVWTSKARSAWLLHTLTESDNLQLFIAFSSITAAVGAPGQSVYGAANAFLDDLMTARRARGLVGVSVQWPAVSDVGMAVSLYGTRTSAESGSISSAHFQNYLAAILNAANSAPPVVTLMPKVVLPNLHPSVAAQYAPFCDAQVPGKPLPSNQSVKSSWSADAVDAAVDSIIASLLGESGIDSDAQLMDIGLDSLGATELATRLSVDFGVKVPSTFLFSYPTVREIKVFFHQELGLTTAVAQAADDQSGESRFKHGDVGIVGVSCRLPGDINDLPSLWATLVARESKVSEVSLHRWDTDAIVAMMGEENFDTVNRIRYGGFLSDAVIESFNAAFFGISEAEASRMDPAQRLLLTVSYEALVDAGYSKETVRGRNVGVFVGASGNIGESTLTDLHADTRKSTATVYDATGKTLSVAAGRISYALGLSGPCYAVDTACSSSLVALHNARRALQLGECDIAIVACEGILTASSSVACAVAGMTSVDGKCHTFDADAKGYGRGEGAGAIVLERLSERSSGFYAIVRGSAVLQDGKSASLTAPNGLAQQTLIKLALRDANLAPRDVTFIEAHGTGTKLGDPVEVGALRAVFADEEASAPLYLSSVKGNIGHLESAAGLAGLFSAILSLMHGVAPPNAELHCLNPDIAPLCDDTRLRIAASPQNLVPGSNGSIIAGVSSFGYSGTIAHVLLEQTPTASRASLRTVDLDLKHAQRRLNSRMLYSSKMEELSGLLVTTCKLHRGIWRDWAQDVCSAHGEQLPLGAVLEFALATAEVAAPDSAADMVRLLSFTQLSAVGVTDPTMGTGMTTLKCSSAPDGTIGMFAEGNGAARTCIATASSTVGNDGASASPSATIKVTEDCTTAVDVDELDSCGGVQMLSCKVDARRTTCVMRMDSSDLRTRAGYMLAPPTLDLTLRKSARELGFAYSSKVSLTGIRARKVIFPPETDVIVRRSEEDAGTYSIAVVDTVTAEWLLLIDEVRFSDGEIPTRLLQLVPVWESDPSAPSTTLQPAHRIVMISDCLTELSAVATSCGMQTISTESAAGYNWADIDIVLVCVKQWSSMDARTGVSALNQICKLLDTVANSAKRMTVLTWNQTASSVLSGFVLSAQAEYPRLSLQIVLLDEAVPFVTSVAQACGELRVDVDLEVAYKEGSRLVKSHKLAQFQQVLSELSCCEGTIVISGGTGALGLKSARLLVDMGAKAIVLLSRSGVSQPGQGLEEDLQWLLNRTTATVRVLRCDVSVEEDVQRTLAEVRATMPAIVGVVHSAGIIRDGLIRHGAASSGSAAVWNAKATSAYLLHKYTMQDDLKVFVVYSSVTAAVGAPGQSIYGAANRYLSQLVEDRCSAGLPGLCIQWPAICDVGMAAAMNFASSQSCTSTEAMAICKSLLLAQATGTVTILPQDIIDGLHPSTAKQFPHFKTNGNVQSPARTPTMAKQFTVLEVEAIVRETVAELTSCEDLAMDAQLMDSGLDSLGVTELSARLSARFQTKVAATLLFSYPTLGELTDFFLKEFHLFDVADAVDTKRSFSGLAAGDVAIIGAACRLPGDINDLPSLWSTLCAKEDKISEVSLNRWDARAIAAMLGESAADVVDRIRYGGFMSDEVIESFDAAFFGISEAEASRMDPAQRLLLTVSYDALVDAGYSKETVKGKNVGVFVGASGVVGESPSAAQTATVESSVYDATGKTLSVAAGRISYSLGLCGPCSAVDTACSSSLVALHNARRALQLGECEIAIVASDGVLTASSSIACAVAGMTSSDGKCHTFDADAKGYGRGEGAGAIVLTLNSTAVVGTCNAYAIVRGSAVAQDGKSASLTAPNGLAQEQLLRTALRDASLESHEIAFIEAHGTGTKLGDPVETAALANVFGSGDTPLYVTGVKANIGHLEAAAGMAGLFSAILSLHHECVPPNGQLRALNDEVAVSAAHSRLQFPTEVTPLSCVPGKKLLAGVSSFGYSGTIAHVVLEEPAQGMRKLLSNKILHGDNTARYAMYLALYIQLTLIFYRSSLSGSR